MAKDVRLPKVDLEDYRAIDTAAVSKIWKILWAVDPARIRVIPDETLRNLLQISVNHAVREANLEIELRKNDITAFEAMGKALAKF